MNPSDAAEIMQMIVDAGRERGWSDEKIEMLLMVPSLRELAVSNLDALVDEFDSNLPGILFRVKTDGRASLEAQTKRAGFDWVNSLISLENFPQERGERSVIVVFDTFFFEVEPVDNNVAGLLKELRGRMTRMDLRPTSLLEALAFLKEYRKREENEELDPGLFGSLFMLLDESIVIEGKKHYVCFWANDMKDRGTVLDLVPEDIIFDMVVNDHNHLQLLVSAE